MLHQIIGAVLVAIGGIGLTYFKMINFLNLKKTEDRLAKESMNDTIPNYKKKVIRDGIFAILVIIGSILLIVWAFYPYFELI